MLFTFHRRLSVFDYFGLRESTFPSSDHFCHLAANKKKHVRFRWRRDTITTATSTVQVCSHLGANNVFVHVFKWQAAGRKWSRRVVSLGTDNGGESAGWLAGCVPMAQPGSGLISERDPRGARAFEFIEGFGGQWQQSPLDTGAHVHRWGRIGHSMPHVSDCATINY